LPFPNPECRYRPAEQPMNGTSQRPGCRTVIRLKAVPPSAASIVGSAGMVSRQSVKTIPNATGGMDWKTMTPAMLPRARVSALADPDRAVEFFGQFGGQRRDDQGEK
jgi:hypothetical protein